jgi:hypothetical protein
MWFFPHTEGFLSNIPFPLIQHASDGTRESDPQHAK